MFRMLSQVSKYRLGRGFKRWCHSLPWHYYDLYFCTQHRSISFRIFSRFEYEFGHELRHRTHCHCLRFYQKSFSNQKPKNSHLQWEHQPWHYAVAWLYSTDCLRSPCVFSPLILRLLYKHLCVWTSACFYWYQSASFAWKNRFYVEFWRDELSNAHGRLR